MEAEASLGANLPDMMASMPNRGSDTPASNAVKLTGLQPQVDSEEIHTKQKDEQDKLMAVDAMIQRLDKQLPQGSDSDTPKLNRFRKIWSNLKQKWDNIKMQDDNFDSEMTGGLGNETGDKKYVKKMQQNPNLMPAHQSDAFNVGPFGMT